MTTDKNLTDNEVIKTLESKIHLAEYVDSDYCSNVKLEIIKSALDLITRQLAKIERLETELDFAKAFRKETDAEFSLMHRKYGNMIKAAKSKAVKEFAERLDNETFDIYYAGSLYHVVDIDDVKEILKEMLSDNNDS